MHTNRRASRTTMMLGNLTSAWIFVALLLLIAKSTQAFVLSPVLFQTLDIAGTRKSGLFLAKKKRRRRKIPVPPGTSDSTGSSTLQPEPEISASPPLSDAAAANSIKDIGAENRYPESDEREKGEASEELAAFRQVANFAFQPKTDPTKKVPIVDIPDSVIVNDVEMDDANDLTASKAIPLPDIREARRVKQAEQKKRDQDFENKNRKVKIKRSDTAAFTKLLEQEPFADADDSFFEDEEYGTVSALLGERAKPFLGIPLGPLQVGHLIGSLGIVLMAFVEYPGFPLTNLPTPLRECFQGGLLTVYSINMVLAVLAAFKAPKRGQPIPLWAAKTFAVGGLAYDQLMQLPTTAAIEKAKTVKGKRAIKRR